MGPKGVMGPKGPSPPAKPSQPIIRQEITSLIDLQSKLLGEAIERMQREHSHQNESLNTRLGEVTRSLEFAQLEMAEMKGREADARRANEMLRAQVDVLATENTQLKADMVKMSDRLDYQEDQSRRNNLRFSGIPEVRGENWEQCQEKLTKLLRQHLHITPQIERAHRVGQHSLDKPRDIVAKFSRFADRDAVFRDKAKFRNAPIRVFVYEDFCSGTIKARKDQMEQLRQARNAGKNAYFSYRKLVVHERTRPRPQTNSALPMPPPTSTSDSLQLPRPIGVRSPRVSLSDPPSPLLQRPSTPLRNTPLRPSYADVARTPEGATGYSTSPRHFAVSDASLIPISQRLRSRH